MTALGTDHAGTKGPDGRLVREAVAAELGAVAAMKGAAIDEKITAAEPPDVGQGDRLERLAPSWAMNPTIGRQHPLPQWLPTRALPGGVRGKARKFRFALGAVSRTGSRRAGGPVRENPARDRTGGSARSPGPKTPPRDRDGAGHPRVGPSRSDCPIRSAAVRVVPSESLNAELTASPF
jgi:hypothetical protein